MFTTAHCRCEVAITLTLQMQNWGTENLSHLSQVAQLIQGKDRFQGTRILTTLLMILLPPLYPICCLGSICSLNHLSYTHELLMWPRLWDSCWGSKTSRKVYWPSRRSYPTREKIFSCIQITSFTRQKNDLYGSERKWLTLLWWVSEEDAWGKKMSWYTRDWGRDYRLQFGTLSFWLL